ncbi:MAG: HAD hydrolase-like protein [Oscillospiraceae bacterium]|nr:HAD hydrolase-like protein [Oscillospiraceae bacterium]
MYKNIIFNLDTIINSSKDELYEGISDILSAVKEYDRKVMLVSSMSSVSVCRILEDKKILHFFDYIGNSNFTDSLEMKEEAIKNISTTGITAEESVMISDRKEYINMAQKCDIDAIGVLYGAGKREELKDAKYIVQTVRELFILLLTGRDDLVLNEIQNYF